MIVNEISNDNYPLHEAVSKGQVDLVESLIQDPKLVNLHHTETKETPLHIAAAKGNIPILQMLLKANAEINATDDKQFTPLAKAVLWKNEEMVDALLIAGADVNAFKGYKGNTIMHLAMQSFHVGIVFKLMEYGASIEENDNGDKPDNHFFGHECLDLFDRFDRLCLENVSVSAAKRWHDLLEELSNQNTVKNKKEVSLKDPLNTALIARTKLAMSDNPNIKKTLIKNLSKCEVKETDEIVHSIIDLLHNEHNFSETEEQVTASGESFILNEEF